MESEKHRYSAHGDAIVRGGQGSIAFAYDAKDAAEIAGELNDLLDRVAALEAERDEAHADCKAMAAALGNAFPMKNVHVSCGTASHVVVFLGVLETPELLAVVRRWRP